MFSQVCINNPSVRGGTCVTKGGMYGKGVHAWQRGHAWRGGTVHGKGGACVEKGGICGEGACVARGRAWQERRLLQRTVRILLECILVPNDYPIIPND